MGRPAGRRDKDYDARRGAILDKMTARLAQPGAMHASYRELADAGGVSISTLQHYFGKRADIVAAVLRHAQIRAAPHFTHLRDTALAFPESVAELLAYVRLGFERFGVDAIHAIGLVEGLREPASGPVAVDTVLEPSLEAIAARLAAHQARGEMRPGDPRHGALILLAPAILILLHQRDLGGAAHHPMDLDAFFADHAAWFVRAHGCAAGGFGAP